MPPKNKFTKDEVIQAALALARAGGMQAVTARALGAALGTSAKPIFGLFAGMEEVHQAILVRADELYQKRTAEVVASGKYLPYKATGMAYILFAREEPALFKMLFMRDRTDETIPDGPTDEIRPLIQIIQASTGLFFQMAFRLHLETWIYVHGIATMLASAYLNWDDNFISQSLTDIFEGLKSRLTHLETEETI